MKNITILGFWRLYLCRLRAFCASIWRFISRLFLVLYEWDFFFFPTPVFLFAIDFTLYTIFPAGIQPGKPYQSCYDTEKPNVLLYANRLFEEKD